MSTTGKVAVALTCAGVGLGAVAVAESAAAREAVGQFVARIGAHEVLLSAAKDLVDRTVSALFDGAVAA
tara:strand:+ start:246 stop:452 length:207 start_codon:yes stop_codon:yes gene_type:complete